MTNWGHLVVWKWLKMVKCALFMVKNGFSWSKMGFRRRWFQWAKFHQLTNPENQNSNFKKPRWATDTSIKKYSKVLKRTLVGTILKDSFRIKWVFQVILVEYGPYDIGSQKAAPIVKIWSMDSGGAFENLTNVRPFMTLKWPLVWPWIRFESRKVHLFDFWMLESFKIVPMCDHEWPQFWLFWPWKGNYYV